MFLQRIWISSGAQRSGDITFGFSYFCSLWATFYLHFPFAHKLRLSVPHTPLPSASSMVLPRCPFYQWIFLFSCYSTVEYSSLSDGGKSVKCHHSRSSFQRTTFSRRVNLWPVSGVDVRDSGTRNMMMPDHTVSMTMPNTLNLANREFYGLWVIWVFYAFKFLLPCLHLNLVQDQMVYWRSASPCNGHWLVLRSHVCDIVTASEHLNDLVSAFYHWAKKANE